MKVNATVVFSAEDRRLVASFLGKDGLASHIDCVAWAKFQISSRLTDLAAAEALKAAARAVLQHKERGTRLE